MWNLGKVKIYHCDNSSCLQVNCKKIAGGILRAMLQENVLTQQITIFHTINHCKVCILNRLVDNVTNSKRR